MSLRLSDFDFDLPAELIAQHPAAQRSASRLLRLTGDEISHHVFSALPDFLRSGDLLVLNDTRVLKARLFGRKPTGGNVEVLIERTVSAHEALALVRASKSPRTGSRIEFNDGVSAEVRGREGDFFLLRFRGEGDADIDVAQVMERHGRLPLPPYIERNDRAHDSEDTEDTERYQTVYARVPGAVAAPTAGLHFDAAMFERLHERGVNTAHLTLHVGAGTFQPVRTEDIAAHRMHSERYSVPQQTADAVATARASGSRVIAVGTTSLRTLESASDETGTIRAGPGDTRLFITPGYRFRVVDMLLTNFHLPRSTLLMLVSAFAGLDSIRRAYAAAVTGRYRFFSYGDAMLIDRAADAAHSSQGQA